MLKQLANRFYYKNLQKQKRKIYQYYYSNRKCISQYSKTYFTYFHRKMNATKSQQQKPVSVVTLPADNQYQYNRLDKILRQKKPMNWMSYEWIYDEVEDIFFNKSENFNSLVEQKFPKLKTRNLNMCEWRAIRKMITKKKPRRFSDKFIDENRIELATFREKYRIYKENPHYHHVLDNSYAVDANVKVLNRKMELMRLMIETQKLLSTKSAAVSKLKKINDSKSTSSKLGSIPDTSSTVAKILNQLGEVSGQIESNLGKLWCFRIVKDAMVFDALDKKIILMLLPTHLFRRRCELRIYEINQSICTDMFIPTTSINKLLNILMELAFAIIEQQSLATDFQEFFTDLSYDCIKQFQFILSAEDLTYFETNCIPISLAMIEKVSP